MQKYLLLILAFTLSNAKGQDKLSYQKNFTEGDFLILESNYTQALKNFLAAYEVDSINANINYKIGFCYLKTATGKRKALKYLEKAIISANVKYTDLEPNEKAAPINAYYYYGQALHLNNRFDDAIENFEKFRSYLRPKQKEFIEDVNRQIEMCNNAKAFIASPINVVINNLGDSINSIYSDHSPLLSGDEKTLIFTSRRAGGTGEEKTIEDEFYEDIYISYKKTDSTWKHPTSISPHINTSSHEASVGLTPDAQTLFIYKDINGGDIYFSTLDGDNWTFPQAMGSNINTKDWETSACLSPDEKTIYFVSDRKENSLGGKDIWKCEKLSNGNWGIAQNLGAPVNTPYDEESPFMHPSGTILFFSSKGHKSMGGYDIFFSNKAGNGWEEPLNIGYPINTTDDDISYVTSPDGKRGYYASAARSDGYGEKDIYLISIPEQKEQALVLIKGFIIPPDGQSLPTDIEIVAKNNETGIISGVYKPMQRDGSFTIIIPPGSNYTLSYQRNGEEFYSETMEAPNNGTYQEINKELKLEPVGIEQNATVISDTLASHTESKIAYLSISGSLYNENNQPLLNYKVNLYNAKGEIIKTTTTNELGWYIFSELPEDQHYLVSLEEEDTKLGSKSSVVFKDKNGKIVKLKASFKKHDEPTKPSLAPVAIKSKAPKVPHEQLAKADKLNFEMFFKYNVKEIDVNDVPFKQYIDSLKALFNKKGEIHINIIASASQVPTRAYASNSELAKERAETAKTQLIKALNEKGINSEKIKFVKIKSSVGGPKYDRDYLINKSNYEKHQFVKFNAY